MSTSGESNKSKGSWASSGLWPQSAHNPACEVGKTPLPRPTPIDATLRKNTESKESQTRTDILKVRCTKDEKSSWVKFAKGLGLSISAMFRSAVNKLAGIRDNLIGLIQRKSQLITIPEPLLREINSIGVNINQIAHAVNITIRNGEKVDWITIISKLINIECLLIQILKQLRAKEGEKNDRETN